ncbi:hypothetical protein [Nostoc sp.]
MPPRQDWGNESQGAQRETGGVRDFGDPRVAVCNHLGYTERMVYWAMLAILVIRKMFIHG